LSNFVRKIVKYKYLGIGPSSSAEKVNIKSSVGVEIEIPSTLAHSTLIDA